jgi:hypothetical protein
VGEFSWKKQSPLHALERVLQRLYEGVNDGGFARTLFILQLWVELRLIDMARGVHWVDKRDAIKPTIPSSDPDIVEARLLPAKEGIPEFLVKVASGGGRAASCVLLDYLVVVHGSTSLRLVGSEPPTEAPLRQVPARPLRKPAIRSTELCKPTGRALSPLSASESTIGAEKGAERLEE